jgi:hypothetical protein
MWKRFFIKFGKSGVKNRLRINRKCLKPKKKKKKKKKPIKKNQNTILFIKKSDKNIKKPPIFAHHGGILK